MRKDNSDAMDSIRRELVDQVEETCQLRQEHADKEEQLRNQNEHAIEVALQDVRRQLDESERARKELKGTIEEQNINMMQFEVNLFESKKIQLDLLEQLKRCEQ